MPEVETDQQIRETLLSHGWRQSSSAPPHIWDHPILGEKWELDAVQLDEQLQAYVASQSSALRRELEQRTKERDEELEQEKSKREATEDEVVRVCLSNQQLRDELSALRERAEAAEQQIAEMRPVVEALANLTMYEVMPEYGTHAGYRCLFCEAQASRMDQVMNGEIEHQNSCAWNLAAEQTRSKG